MFPKRYYRIAFALCLIFFALILSTEQAGAQQETMAGGDAWVIPIHGDIMPSLATFVRREARRAVNHGAEFIIFEIDTFGGRVDSALQIASFIMSLRNVRTIAWVTSGEDSMGVSWSAGALIAMACREIYMAPGTSMGAAAPVMASPGGAAQAADEKTVAAVRSQIAALAERNGHPVGLALAMVDFDVELWEVRVDGQTRALTFQELERLERDARGTNTVIERIGVISEVGKLLSLTAGEALHFGLLAGIAEDQESLAEVLGITGEITRSYPSAADSLISFLTSGPVQTLLILLGLVMIFLEIQSPGIGIPGTVAVIAFLVVFGSSALLGRVGSLEILLFIVGVGLLAVEIFVLPGFGVAGISGLIVIGLSLVLSMQDFVIPSFDWEWALFGRNALVVFAGVIASVTGIAIVALTGPKLRMFDALTLKTAITGTAGGPDPESTLAKTVTVEKALPLEDEENFAALVGKTGIADTVLRPSGRALIDGKIYSVDADNEFVDAGMGIVVTRVWGNKIVVRKA